MNHVALALVLGLLAGVAGGLSAGLVSGTDGEEPGLGTPGHDLTAIEQRLARIEARLGEAAPMTLRGAERVAPDTDLDAVAEAVAERLDARVKETVRAGVAEAWRELGEPAPAPATAPPRRAKKRATLAEAAADLSLSAAEEDALRTIYAETVEKALGLLAEDGDKEAVRRDLEQLRQDPNQRMAMVGKYMPRMIPKLGEFIGLQMDRERRIREAIGGDKADRLDREFDVEEADPFGFSGNMQIEARGGMR